MHTIAEEDLDFDRTDEFENPLEPVRFRNVRQISRGILVSVVKIGVGAELFPSSQLHLNCNQRLSGAGSGDGGPRGKHARSVD